MTMKHEKTVAFVWGSEPPAFSIGWEEPMGPGDSGFTVLFDDAPELEEVQGAEHPGISFVCLDCLIDDHPDLGRGLDLAREHGAADRNDDGWVGRQGGPLA